MHILRVLGLLVALWCSAASFAQTTAPAVKNTARQLSIGAGRDTVRIGGIDCLVTPCGADIIDRAISQHPKISTDGGLPKIEADSTLRNPSGRPIPVKASGRVGGAAAAKIIGKAIAKNLIPGVGVAVAVKEVATELGWDFNLNPDGTTTIRKPDPTVCTVAPCFTYKFTLNSGFSPEASTQPGAAAAYEAATKAAPQCDGFGCYYWKYIGPSGVQSHFRKYKVSNNEDQGANSYLNPVKTSIPAASDAWKPSDQQEFIDKIATQSGWPSSSAIKDALSEASKSTGDAIEVIPSTQTVTGPATSAGTTSTTNNTVDNSTTTNTTTHNHSYAGDTITTNNTTTSVTINNTTGAVTNNTSTSSTTAAQPAEVETCGLPGKPACKIDETGTPTYDPEKFKLDKAKLDQDALDLRNKVKGSEDKGMFSSWGQFFSLPALRACEPLQLPVYFGYALPSMDVCPGAEWLRNLMGFVWAIAGFAFCFKSVQDSI